MSTATSITVRVPLAIRRRPGRKTVVTPLADGVASVTTHADPALAKALARAFRYQRMLDEGRYGAIGDLATSEKLDRGFLGKLLRLTLLSPEIVEGFLSGRLGLKATLPSLMKPLPAGWREQMSALGATPETRSKGEPSLGAW